MSEPQKASPQPILLSVLIPTLPERWDKLRRLEDRLLPQMTDQTEMLVLSDNRRRTLGAKRNALLAAAQGEYVVHLDDDDLVSEDFVARILDARHMRSCIFTGTVVPTEDYFMAMALGVPEAIAMKHLYLGVDVIHYDSEARLGTLKPFVVHTEPGAEVEAVTLDAIGNPKDIRRPPWHWCAWHRRIWSTTPFPDITWGEDWEWLQKAHQKCRTHARIDAVLHYYIHDSTTCAD